MKRGREREGEKTIVYRSLEGDEDGWAREGKRENHRYLEGDEGEGLGGREREVLVLEVEV